MKSHESGLAIPDWPNTWGYFILFFPPSEWVGGVFHQHVHRLVASLVGLMSLALALWLRKVESREWVRDLSYVTFGLIVLQGVMGGLTVLYVLPVFLSTLHAVLAQICLVLLVVIAYGLSKEYRGRMTDDRATGAMVKGAVVLLLVIFVELVVGSLMRHVEAGLAIPDFPTTAGKAMPIVNQESLAWINNWRIDYSFETGMDLPAVDMGQMMVHLVHRYGAALVVLVMVVLTLGAFVGYRTRAHLLKTVLLIDVLVVLQAVLGAYTIWTGRTAWVASMHVTVGAAILAAAAILLLRAVPISSDDS